MWYTFSFHTPSAFTTVAQRNVWEAGKHPYLPRYKTEPGDFFYRMKKCFIFAPQDSSIYAAHTSMRYHSTCVPQLRVCSPVGFNRVTNSFVSRETPGPYPPPFRIDDTETCWTCSPLVLNLLPTNNGFLPSASGLEKETVYSLYGQRSKRLHQHPHSCTSRSPSARKEQNLRILRRGLHVITDSRRRSLCFLSCHIISSVGDRNLELTFVKPETSPLARGLLMDGV